MLSGQHEEGVREWGKRAWARASARAASARAARHAAAAADAHFAAAGSACARAARSSQSRCLHSCSLPLALARSRRNAPSDASTRRGASTSRPPLPQRAHANANAAPAPFLGSGCRGARQGFRCPGTHNGARRGHDCVEAPRALQCLPVHGCRAAALPANSTVLNPLRLSMCTRCSEMHSMLQASVVTISGTSSEV